MARICPAKLKVMVCGHVKNEIELGQLLCYTDNNRELLCAMLKFTHNRRQTEAPVNNLPMAPVLFQTVSLPLLRSIKVTRCVRLSESPSHDRDTQLYLLYPPVKAISRFSIDVPRPSCRRKWFEEQWYARNICHVHRTGRQPKCGIT